MPRLLKPFWTGVGGWADRQLPDGTLVWAAPIGETYKTPHGSRIFFPAWDTATTGLPKAAATLAQPASRGLMMPKRRRTRATERAHRIREERDGHQEH